MIRSRPVTSTAEALRHVFIGSSTSHGFQSLLSLHATSSTLRASRCPLARDQIRTYAQQRPAQRVTRPPRDEEIPSRMVTVVNAENHLAPPALKSRILSDIDRSTQILVQVAHPEPEEPPICRIYDKKTLFESERARAKVKKTHLTVKELELNWAIDPNDLAHRLDKMQGFLEKGARVEIVVAPKRKGRRATQDEAANVLRKIRDRVEEVAGAKESKEAEGKILGQYKLIFERK